ncbi:hypothetical protein R4M06_00870 [Brachyspira pilosicoli]|uniref:hypothetical protein n=1 Tax=Brachyspira pilosicoli TaxID=52584 RepID=UPI0030041867
MGETFISLDNTRKNQTIAKIKGNYNDVLIGYAILIYHTAITTDKTPEDVVCDIVYNIKNNKETLYQYLKNTKKEKKNERKNKKRFEKDYGKKNRAES